MTIVATADAQSKTSACQIGKTTFACPKGFVKLPDIGDSTRLFRSKDKDGILYLFVAVSKEHVDTLALKKALESGFTGNSKSVFSWKPVVNPLFMDLDTKYKMETASFYGLHDKHLLEMKYFDFSVKGQKVRIGYASDLGETVEINKRLFERGEAISDTAVGCNAVATLLNSITKEFKEKEQRCSLSALTIGSN